MASLNKIILIGRLTADPELRVTTEGKSVTKFTLAVDRPFTNGEKTDFIPIVSWEKQAEQAGNFFHKGYLVLVEGRINNSSYENKEGETVWTTEVVANFMRMLEKKSGRAAPAESKKKGSAPQPDHAMTEDDIPF